MRGYDSGLPIQLGVYACLLQIPEGQLLLRGLQIRLGHCRIERYQKLPLMHYFTVMHVDVIDGSRG